MRLQGKITRWDDDKGFGFIDWLGDNTSTFAHITAFAPRSRRPEIGDIVTYKISKDKNGKKKAVNVRWIDEPNRQKRKVHSTRRSVTPVIFTAFFITALLVATYLNRIPWLVVAAYAAMSFVTFIAYGLDKSSARKGNWRTSESTLHLFGLACGWPGALMAQRVFRHKSSKTEFLSVFWVTVIFNVTVLGYLIWEGHNGSLNQLIEAAKVAVVTFVSQLNR